MNKKSGFTLIEILVVVAIIGLLTALLLVNLVGVRERGADTRKKSNLNQFRTALRLYYNDFQSYPQADGNDNLLGCGDGTSACAKAGGDDLTNGSGTIYMKGTPEYTEYSRYNNGDSFYLGVELANESDSGIAESVNLCAPSPATPGVFYICSE